MVKIIKDFPKTEFIKKVGKPYIDNILLDSYFVVRFVDDLSMFTRQGRKKNNNYITPLRINFYTLKKEQFKNDKLRTPE